MRTIGVERPSISVHLAALHFGLGIVYLVLGAAGLVWVAPMLASGTYLAPRVAGVTHLFTLGWLTTTIFGALYQLLPGALGAPIRFPRLGYASVWTFVPGVGFFAIGIATETVALHHTGIGLVALGASLALGNIVDGLRRARMRDVTWLALALSTVYLASTFVLGVLLLHNLHTGVFADARVRILAVHLHVALVGWALVLSVGFSHRLLPMFLMTRNADTRWTKRALALLVAGLLVLAVGVIAQIAWAAWSGLLLLEGGIGCFVWQSYAFYRARGRIDVAMRFVALAIGFFVASALLGPAVLVGGALHARLATTYVVTGLLGGFVLYVIGFSYKIAPSLAWSIRYSAQMGSEQVPSIPQMVSVRAAHAQLGIMAVAVICLAGGIAFGWPHLTRGGGVLFLSGVLLYVRQVWYMAFGRAAKRSLP